MFLDCFKLSWIDSRFMMNTGGDFLAAPQSAKHGFTSQAREDRQF
jgi:hypothetical protein